MTRRASLAAAFALASAALAGCGTQTLVAGLLAGLPQVTYQPPQTCSGGVCVTPAPQKFGPYTILTGAVFTIDTSDPTKIQDAKVTGVSGVNASVNYRSCLTLTGATLADCLAGNGGLDRVFPVLDKGSGIYMLTNNDIASSSTPFAFESGVRYTMVLEVPQCPDGKATCAAADQLDVEAYGASFKPGPAAHMVQFADKSKPVTLAPGSDYTVDRDDVLPDGTYLPAFVLVGQIDPNNPAAVPNITWNSISQGTWPPDPKKLLLLALSDQPYRVKTIKIDKSAFTSSGYYMVAMLSIAEGKASANAFIGSTALAASGDTGLVITQ
jgi:hypothetical protein